MVNEVCQRVAGALEKPMMTNSHMGLVMSLAKHNSLIVEAYARLLIHSAIKILNIGASEGNSQKRLVAIQVINFLMKCLDYKCILPELGFIIGEMQKCEDDQMAYVKGAAFEAKQTAKRIWIEKGSKYEKRSGQRGDGNRSPLTASPESQTMGYFGGYSSVINSPFSVSVVSQETNSNRSVSRKLWRYENGGVDVSLKHGLFSGGMSTSTSMIENFENNRFSEDQGGYADGFSGFLQKSGSSDTPSPQISCSCINLDNIRIFTTPRKLVKSFQASNEVHSDLSENQSQKIKSPQSPRLRSLLAKKSDQSSTSKYDQNGLSCDLSDCFTHNDQEFYDTSESVASTKYICQELVPETKAMRWSFALRILSSFIVLFAIVVCFLLVGDTDEDYNLAPT